MSGADTKCVQLKFAALIVAAMGSGGGIVSSSLILLFSQNTAMLDINSFNDPFA